MKQTIAACVTCALVALMVVAAQAEVKGEQIFKQKCAMCHLVKGKGGSIGPELTKVAARMKESDLTAKLENPKKSNPSTSMPSFKSLPKADMDALLGYLKTLK
ncbi:MAG: cytochrome c [Desulfuromonadales bacterium]